MDAPYVDDRTLVQTWRQSLRAGREKLREEYLARPQAGSLLRRQCALVDQALRALWAAFAMPSATALVAVGGYGRGELFPYSDVDVLILCADHCGEDDEAAISRFVSVLWDIGLELGHSVRTIDECAREMRADITVRTTVLENRHLAGSRRLFRALREVFVRELDIQSFFDAKLLEQQQRHIHYHDLSSNLEPNLKGRAGHLVATACPARPADPRRGAPGRQQRTAAAASADTAPLPRRPARRPAGVRSAETAGDDARPHRPAAQARERADDAALLSRGEVGPAGQRVPAAGPPYETLPRRSGSASDR